MTACAICGNKLPFFYVNRFGGVHYFCMGYYSDAKATIETKESRKALSLAKKNYRKSRIEVDEFNSQNADKTLQTGESCAGNEKSSAEHRNLMKNTQKVKQ